MIRADTGSLQFYETPVVQPVVMGFARSFSWQKPAQFQSGCRFGLQAGFFRPDKTHNCPAIIDVLRA
jgi:hypothetical protein